MTRQIVMGNIIYIFMFHRGYPLLKNIFKIRWMMYNIVIQYIIFIIFRY